MVVPNSVYSLHYQQRGQLSAEAAPFFYEPLRLNSTFLISPIKLSSTVSHHPLLPPPITIRSQV
jgi:hypothetical protein